MLILHGDHLVASRRFLDEKISQAKTKEKEIIRLDGAKLSLAELKQALEAKSLFGQEKTIVIENLLSSPTSKQKKELLTYLQTNPAENLILWEPKAVGKQTSGILKKAAVRLFRIPATIFSLLDSLSPKNQKQTLARLHQCLKQEPAEMIFYMLARRMRFLIIAKDLGEKGLTRMAPWQKSRLLGQAKKFSPPQLLAFHRWLLKIDWQQKTGRAPMPLASQLDLLLASL